MIYNWPIRVQAFVTEPIVIDVDRPTILSNSFSRGQPGTTQPACPTCAICVLEPKSLRVHELERTIQQDEAKSHDEDEFALRD
jgi:hypothetical protein